MITENSVTSSCWSPVWPTSIPCLAQCCEVDTGVAPPIHICLNSNSRGQTSTCPPLKQPSHHDICLEMNVVTYRITKNSNSALFQQNGLHESALERVCITISKLGSTHSNNAIWSWSAPNYGWTWKIQRRKSGLYTTLQTLGRKRRAWLLTIIVSDVGHQQAKITQNGHLAHQKQHEICTMKKKPHSRRGHHRNRQKTMSWTNIRPSMSTEWIPRNGTIFLEATTSWRKTALIKPLYSISGSARQSYYSLVHLQSYNLIIAYVQRRGKTNKF